MNTRTVHLIAISLVLAPTVLGQTDTSSLNGRITDPQGGAIPGAQIVLTNEGTHAERKIVSGDRGAYIFTLIPPGRYDIEASAPGFKTFHDTGFQVDVAAPALLNIQLEIGAISDFVQVEGEVSLLNTESAAQGTVIGEEKIVSLPLNGRQFIDLALLSPNVTIGGESVQQNQVRKNQDGGFSASGNRTNNNGFMLDGITNLDPDYMSLSLTPILDTLAEFQVQTGQQHAEYGHAAGAQVNVVTKSGGNEIHGDVWEFVRNRVFDSRPFNLASSLPKYQRNQFGGTIGGPIRKNKIFLFGGYERLSLRQAAGGLTTVTVPTPLEKQGNFTADPIIYDALTSPRVPFAGNIIPQTRLNPLAVIAINAAPLADVPGTSNQYVNSDEVASQDSHNYSARADYVVTPTITMFGRYSGTHEGDSTPGEVPGRATIGTALPQNGVYAMTWVLGPHAVNEFRAGFNRMKYSTGTPEPLFDVNGVQSPLPYFETKTYADMGGAGGGNTVVRDNTFQIYDNFSYQKGRHLIKAGAEWMFIQYVNVKSANYYGTYQFSNGQSAKSSATDGSGSVLASFLLGYSSIPSRTLGAQRMDGHQPIGSFYVQDQIRVTTKLTVDLGLRYEIAPPLYDTRGQTMGLDFSKVPSAQAIFASGQTGIYEPIFFICGQSGYPKSCAYTDKNNFAPRFGLAWQAAPKTVFRMGAGIYYSLTDFSSISRLTNSLPATIAQTLTSTTFAPLYQGYGTSVFPASVVVGPSLAANLYSIDLNQRTSYAIQMSASLQHQMGKDGVIEIGYLGTLGIKLQQNVQVSNSLPGPSATTSQRRAYVGAIFAPGTVFPSYINVQGASVGGGTIAILPNIAQSNYHSMYLRGERRFTHGFSYLSSFTYSKAITNAPQFRNAGGATGSENSPPQNSYDLSAERGLASFNAKFRWVNTAVYELPFGGSKRWLSHGLASQILGGWQLAGIMSMQTGFPFTINISGDTAGIGGGSGGILIRGNPVPGQSAELPADKRSTEEWFNTAAFVAPPAQTFGLLGRNTLVGPGLFNIDTTFSKKFKIRERYGVEIRAEAFNLTNKPNYSQIGRIINASDYGMIDSEISPRQLQFGGKVTF